MPDYVFIFDLADVVLSAVTAGAILVGAWLMLFIAKRVVRRAITVRIPRIKEESSEELAQRSTTISQAVNQAISVVVWTIAGVMVLGEFGVAVAPMLAALGLAGLAVGFAAQNLIRDYLNGLFIVMEDWYRVGEVAQVAGIAGLVVELNLRRTVLRDLDGKLHNIPNSEIGLGTNMTRDWARVNLDITVAYAEDLERVVAIVDQIGEGLKEDAEYGPMLVTTPKVLRVNGLGASGVDLKILADTKPMQQWALTGELRRRIKDEFDREGVEIPWPHTKVYFGDQPRSGEVPQGAATGSG